MDNCACASCANQICNHCEERLRLSELSENQARILELLGSGEWLFVSGHVFQSRAPDFCTCLRCGRSGQSGPVVLRDPCDGPSLTLELLQGTHVGHWTINGEPACQSPLTLGIQPPTYCACTYPNFVEMRRRVLDRSPGAECAWHPEKCSVNARIEAEEADRRDAEEERWRSVHERIEAEEADRRDAEEERRR